MTPVSSGCKKQNDKKNSKRLIITENTFLNNTGNAPCI